MKQSGDEALRGGEGQYRAVEEQAAEPDQDHQGCGDGKQRLNSFFGIAQVQDQKRGHQWDQIIDHGVILPGSGKIQAAQGYQRSGDAAAGAGDSGEPQNGAFHGQNKGRSHIHDQHRRNQYQILMLPKPFFP